jgi:hypothetical protein
MFILRDLARPLQAHFFDTDLGKERASLLVYTLLSIIVPFTSSLTSNCLRCLVALFGIEIKEKRFRFYTFMASSSLPWRNLWQTVWGYQYPPLKQTAACWWRCRIPSIPKSGKISLRAIRFSIMPPKRIKANILGRKILSRSAC